MKFFALLVLPQDIDGRDAELIQRAASALMRPFKMWEDDVPVKDGHWDYFWCCTKEWMEQTQMDYAQYTGVPPDQPFIIFPIEQIGIEGIPDSIVTPDGKWHRSNSTYTQEDASWKIRALHVLRSFPGHLAVLAYCHG